MKKNKLLLASAIMISILTPMSQVKADWKRDNVGWWYSLNNGSYYKNTGAYIDGKWYRFDDRGYMMTGWQPLAERNATSLKKINWSYFDPVNGDQKIGWQNIDGNWYYLGEDNDGRARQNEWAYDSKTSKWYYFNDNCAMVQSKWIKYKNEWYYLNRDGSMATGWLQDGSKLYLLYSNGVMAHDTVLYGYKFDYDGVAAKV